VKDNDLSMNISRDLDGSGDGWSDLEVDDIPAAGLGLVGGGGGGGGDALGGLTLLDGGELTS
jgi:hypothetical protein